ncbi:MAG: TraB/TrbI/VirB10 family type IV secretion system protein [Candidatus Acidiferrales bacterium]
MNKLGFSFLLVAAIALTAGAQSANQQYRSNDRQQAQAQQTKSSPSTSKQSGAQGAASASASGSTNASANAGGTSADLSSGTTINTELQTTLDARKCHPGQRVVAKTTQDVKEDGHVVLRKGTRLIGHVTEAQARTKANAESSVGIVFDEAIMKKGQEVPFHATIQALAAAQATSAASLDNDMMEPSAPPMDGGAMGGGLVGGAGSAVGSTAGATRGMAGNLSQTANGAVGATSATAASAGGNLRGLNAAGQLTSSSSGVIGMNGMNLTSAAANSTQGYIVTSAKRNVHLSSGTQMLLRVNGQ